MNHPIFDKLHFWILAPFAVVLAIALLTTAVVQIENLVSEDTVTPAAPPRPDRHHHLDY